MIKVTLKEYLARLEKEEMAKPFSERGNVPSLMDISKHSGIAYSIVSRFANDRMKRFHLESIESIIKALRSMGREVELSDILEFQPEFVR